jgi:hypothetical protein
MKADNAFDFNRGSSVFICGPVPFRHLSTGS